MAWYLYAFVVCGTAFCAFGQNNKTKEKKKLQFKEKIL